MKTKIKSIFPQFDKIDPKFRIVIPFVQKEYLVNGQIKEWSGSFEKVYSPIHFHKDGEYDNFIGKYPLMDKQTSLDALDAAVLAYDNGQGEWPRMSIEKRIQHLKKFTTLMKQRRTEVVNLLMWEIGKSYNDSLKEFDRTVDYIYDTIEALKETDRDASRFKIKQGIIAQIRRAPLGVVLCMGPFNYPLNETFTTLIPALIMGNTVIFKPPKLGVLLHSPLLHAFKEAFPPGVVNTVYGDGQCVIAPLMESGKIDILAFIGSSKVADILKKQHPKPHRMKAVLGLEAKNPAIILEDANLDITVSECVTGSLSYNGQRCTALKIIFVHQNIADKFINKFSEEVQKLKIGIPWDEAVSITPLPEPNKTDYLLGLVDDAIKKGAKLVNSNGGESALSFMYPAIISGIKKDMRIYTEEQFGPVVPIVTYTDINEPLEYVVNSNYGQQASIFGSDFEKISILVDTLVNQVCRVNINSQCQRGPDIFPFTGRKDSAEGTLSVSDALRVFSIRSLVALKENDDNKKILTDILRSRQSVFLSNDYIL